jgi:hypothetical protein
MSDEKIKPGSANGREGFEHQDMQAAGVLYFLVGLVVVTVICMFGLKGLYAYLDHRQRAAEEPVNPLVKHVPEDTRHVAPGYPQTEFPSPKLEEDERDQLNSILLKEDDTLYSYGWVDEKAGTVRIPIERAMDLLAQRGLPVRPQSAAGNESSAANKTETNRRANEARGAHGKVSNQ